MTNITFSVSWGVRAIFFLSSHRLSSARLNSFKKPRETLIAQAFSSGGAGGGGGVDLGCGGAKPGNQGMQERRGWRAYGKREKRGKALLDIFTHRQMKKI